MFLKWILYVFFVVVAARLLRNLFGRGPGRPRRGRLDPGQAVEASWTEVSDEEGEGSGDR